MKYLLVLAVIVVAIWFWRRGRQEEMQMRSRPPPPPTPPAVGAPKAMVRCAYCGLHLPATDAINGPDGIYCSAAHRKAAESQG
jgi:uncharacterized protein